MKNLIIFASGRGTNTKNIIEYFKDNDDVKISLILSDNTNAGVLKIAEQELITYLVNKDLDKQELIDYLKSFNPSLIILAGFLRKIPVSMVREFKNKIVNIHPSLLPKYGGKGMYGTNVHKAVMDAKEDKSGITIHYVNENYDEGNIIFQASCKIKDTDDICSLEYKIHHLEHIYYPEIIDNLLKT